MNGMINSRDEWQSTAQRLGYAVENDGGNKLIAHLDGDERGCWDPNYGGAGFGWFIQLFRNHS